MLLPSAPVRAALKLNDSAQRLYWALNQLFGALPTTPAVAVNVAAGIPAGIVGKGADGFKSFPNFPNRAAGHIYEYNKGYNFEIWLPVNVSQFSRGLSLQKSISVSSTDIVETFVGTIPAGDPIADGSASATIEEYIYEQWMLLKSNRFANSVTLTEVTDGFMFESHVINPYLFGDEAAWNLGDYSSLLLPTIQLKGTILKKPQASNIGNNYGDPSSVIPWNVCDFSTFKTL
jgi:hypothetical protein